MNSEKTIKIIGVVVTLVGFGVTIIQRQLDDKQLCDLIQKEVQKQLRNQ